jgi:hypothetical protein
VETTLKEGMFLVGRQQQQRRQTLETTEAGSTAETLATAGAPGTSTSVRTTVAAGTPETAETITIAGTQRKPTAAITSATAVSVATAEHYYGTLENSMMLAAAIGTLATSASQATLPIITAQKGRLSLKKSN